MSERRDQLPLDDVWRLGIEALVDLRRSHGFDASEAHTGLYAALFGRDSLWTLILLLEAVELAPLEDLGRWVAKAGEDVLRSLCEVQGARTNDLTEEQAGKIVHELRRGPLDSRLLEGGMPFDEGRSYAGFDQTFLFVIAYRKYVDRFPGAAIVVEAWPHIIRALDWIEEFADSDGDGLFEYRRRHPANLVNQVWKDSFDSITHAGFDVPPPPLAWIEVQAYGYRALLDGAELLADRDEGSARGSRLKRLAQRLRRETERQMWLDEDDCYAMALDGTKRPIRMIGSNPGHALWAGIVSQSHQGRLVARLMQPDMMTPFGVRTLSSLSRLHAPFAYHRGSIWPFDNAILASGLLAHGYTREAWNVMHAVCTALLVAGSALEVYDVIEPDSLMRPEVATHALVHHAFGESTGGRAPLNQKQAWTAAALVYFAAALATLRGGTVPPQGTLLPDRSGERNPGNRRPSQDR